MIIVEGRNVRIIGARLNIGVLTWMRRWIRKSGDDEKTQFVRMLYTGKCER